MEVTGYLDQATLGRIAEQYQKIAPASHRGSRGMKSRAEEGSSMLTLFPFWLMIME
jgi:hypothetical protein